MDFFSIILKKCESLKILPTNHCVFVSICEQKFYFFSNGKLVETFKISTSRKTPSCIKDSLGTPWGMHKIDGKIGDTMSIDTVFKARCPIGKISEQSESDKKNNLITSRILRLRGLEEGLNLGGNCDTFERFIYIHGTNQEDKIGKPNSHGCILMNSTDIKRFFDVVSDGSLVLISRE